MLISHLVINLIIIIVIIISVSCIISLLVIIVNKLRSELKHFPSTDLQDMKAMRWGEEVLFQELDILCLISRSVFDSIRQTGFSLTPNALPALKSAFFFSMSCSALASFSCLLLFFQAKNVTRVIRVTSAPRADRYNKDQMIDNYQLQWHVTSQSCSETLPPHLGLYQFL